MNSPHTIEFNIINLFHATNFNEIEKGLFFGTNLVLKWQRY